MQTALFGPRIKALGHELVYGANYGLQGGALSMGDTLVLPSGNDQYSNDVLAAQAQDQKADIVITLYDAWVYRDEVVRRFRWCPYLPVDHDPPPPRVTDVAKLAYQPIAYSKFGQQALLDAGVPNVAYVPHAVDAKLYYPVESLEREQARQRMQVSDEHFLYMMVAANKGYPCRKSFPEVLLAFKRVHERHPDTRLYLHTHLYASFGGPNLHEMITQMELNGVVAAPESYRMHNGFPPAAMRGLFNAADVLVNPALGEGFGLPILEAQACGTPVIVNDCTAMPELLFAGWKTENQAFRTLAGSWQFIPLIDSLEEVMERAYEAKGDQDLRAQAREGALPYDADEVTERYWKPVLDDIELELSAGGLDMPVFMDRGAA